MKEHRAFDVALSPEVLPAGEALLWQGKPRWRSLLRDVFHLRLILLWFGGWMIWELLVGHADKGAWIDGVARALALVPPAVLALGLLAGIAWLMARSTSYTITSRRIVLRHGIALPSILNLPLSMIESADLAHRPHGRGDIPLKPQRNAIVSWVRIWPFVRPWRLLAPEPMLRDVEDVDAVVSILKTAVLDDARRKDRAPKPAPQQTKRRPRIVHAASHPTALAS